MDSAGIAVLIGAAAKVDAVQLREPSPGRPTRDRAHRPVGRPPDRAVTRVREIRCQPESVPAARRFVRDVLSDQSREVLDAAELMTTELATNCVQHAQTCFELAIDAAQREIRVEVRDVGSGRPTRRSPAPTRPHGPGPAIVEAMSDTWGIEPSPRGKTVWFTLPQRAGT